MKILIPAWICNCIYHKLWMKLFKFWKWISNYTPHLTGYMRFYPWKKSLKIIPVSKKLAGHGRHWRRIGIYLVQPSPTPRERC